MAGEQQQLNFATFWTSLGKLVVRLLRERAHGEIVITIQDGNLRLVRVNRNYLPTDLPDL